MSDEIIEEQEDEQLQDEEQSEESQEDEVDYKSLYEQEREAKEAIEAEKRRLQSDRDVVVSRLNKFSKALKSHNVGEVDQDFNLILKQPVSENPIQNIENQIKEIQRKFDNDDLSLAEYTEKITDLKIEKREIEKQSKKQEVETKKSDAISEHFQEMRQKLANDYPDSEIEDSPLFKVMKELLGTNGFGNNSDGVYDKNPYERRKLVEKALDKLRIEQASTKGDARVNQAKQQQPKKAPHSFDKPSQPKEPPKEDVLKSYQEKGIIKLPSNIKPEALSRLRERIEKINALTPDELMGSTIIHQ